MDSALASDNELQIDLSLILFQTSSQEFMSSIFMSTSRDLKFIYLDFKIKFSTWFCYNPRRTFRFHKLGFIGNSGLI